MSSRAAPAIWFPAIRAGSGTDVFTERLVAGLRRRGLRAEITWLPHRAEYAPWTVARLKTPAWATIAHLNTWLPRRFIPPELPFVATMHHCVHDAMLAPYKNYPQTLYHRFWIKPIEQAVLSRAQQVIAVSRYTAARTQAAFPTIQNIAVIHNGIDLNGVFQPGMRKQPNRPFRLLYVGNWSARKGTDLLGPIMTELGSNFELHYTANRLDDSLAEKLPPNTHALDRLRTSEAMADAYRHADALLFPTRLEGFGLVALEAQACGLPVIATRGSALPEVIADGKTGLLCPQDDVAAFAAAARKLADAPALWQQFGKAARTRAESCFDSETMISSHLAIYCKHHRNGCA